MNRLIHGGNFRTAAIGGSGRATPGRGQGVADDWRLAGPTAKRSLNSEKDFRRQGLIVLCKVGMTFNHESIIDVGKMVYRIGEND